MIVEPEIDDKEASSESDNGIKEVTSETKSRKTKEYFFSQTKKSCVLINKYIEHFYDRIYIPFIFFKDEDFDVDKVLDENQDILFYNENWIIKEEDKDRFYQTYDMYTEMLAKIFDPDNMLFAFLKRWEKTGKSNNSNLKKLINDERFKNISPQYISEMYILIKNQYPDNDDLTAKKELEENLIEINLEAKKHIKNFSRNFNKLISRFVYKHPIGKWKVPFEIETEKIPSENYLSRPIIEDIFDNDFLMSFLNSITLEVIKLTDKLIPLNIYPINHIVTDIVEEYIPLNWVMQYNPNYYEGRKLLII